MGTRWKQAGIRGAAAALLICALLIQSGCKAKAAALYVNGDPVADEELALLDGNTEQAVRMKLLQQLAVEYGVAEPFSYSEMLRQLEVENETRTKKAAAGEPVYGLLEYTPLQYYRVLMDSYERAVKDGWIAEAGQDELLAYYEAHKEDYRQIGQITADVRIELGGRVVDEQEIVLSSANYRTLAEGNETLVQVMETLAPGDVQSWTDSQGMEWTVVCTSRAEDVCEDFEDVKGAVSEQWASAKLAEELTARAAASSVQDTRTEQSDQGG